MNLSKKIFSRGFFILGTALFFIGSLMIANAYAVANNQAVAQGYSASTSIQPGMIVSLNAKNPSQVVALSQSNIQAMLGVVISANSAAITLGQTNAHQQVFVTNYGQHDVLVSNQNGPIEVGQYITISDLVGVGMKADSSESLVLGQAAGSFNGTTNVEGTAVLKGSNGSKTTVAIGTIPVDISIAKNPLAQGPKGLPTFLKNITKFATNKNVSATRVYLSLLILLAGVILTITIIYSAVKNGIISLGRNPLAKRAIGGSLFRLIIVAVIIFAISLGVAYLVLL